LRLIRKGEGHLKEISKKSEESLESIVIFLRREKLYYELGKSLSSVSKDKWAQSNKAKNLQGEIKSISKKLKKIKK